MQYKPVGQNWKNNNFYDFQEVENFIWQTYVLSKLFDRHFHLLDKAFRHQAKFLSTFTAKMKHKRKHVMAKLQSIGI